MKETVALERRLRQGGWPGHVQWCARVDSTQRIAKQAARQGALRLIIADEQTEGRGRYGRAFFSPREGLYFTWSIPALWQGPLTPAVAVAVREAVAEQCLRELKIKWVNDLFYQGKKVAGILCERVESITGASFFLCGVGINLQWQTTPGLPHAGGLDCALSEEEKADLVYSVLLRLAALQKTPVSEWMPRYEAALFGLGEEVFLSDGTRGRLLGVDEQGALRVQTAQGEQRRISGEISLQKVGQWEK